MLRFWRHVLRQIPRHLGQDGWRQTGRHRRHRRRGGPGGRPRLLVEYCRQAPSPRPADRGAPCRRDARRHGRARPADRRASLKYMRATSRTFEASARTGLANPILQRALALMQSGFPERRRLAVERLPEFEALRDVGKSIKDHTLEYLDFYLELFEENVMAGDGRVHWARTADEARAAVLQICRSVDAKIVTKGKSMIAEEIGLNEYLEQNGITPVETDLGEYIIQLRHEPPSHLIKEQVADTFRAEHRSLDSERSLAEARQLCDEARAVLRPCFLAADV